MTQRFNRVMRRHGIEPRDPHVRFMKELDERIASVDSALSRIFNERTAYNRACDSILRGLT